MLTRLEIAKLINSETNASKGELVQFFHSNYYKGGLSEEEYVNNFLSFQTELDNYLKENKNWSIDSTFLKGKSFTTSKIPKKVLKQMELDYLENQKFIEQIIREIDN
jgi:hypothetical protein